MIANVIWYAQRPTSSVSWIHDHNRQIQEIRGRDT